MSGRNPPRAAVRLLRLVFSRSPEPVREDIVGSLEREYRSRVAGQGSGKAARWFWRATLSVVSHRAFSAVFDRDAREGRRRQRARGGEASLRRSAAGAGAALILSDLKAALRGLVRAPLFGLAAVATLALGLGVTVATYSVLDSVVLEKLPYPHAERLEDVYSAVPGLGFDRWGVTEAGYLTFARNSRTLEKLGAYRTGSVTLEGEDGARRATAAHVTPSLLDVLGARPARGRLLTEEDARRGASRVALLSHAYWADRYGSDPAAVGGSLELAGGNARIVGVLPRGFELPDEGADVWLPLPVDRQSPDADSHSLRVVGQARVGASTAAVQADLSRLTIRFPELYPEEYSRAWMTEAGFRTVVQPLDREVVDARVRATLWVLMGASVVVLLIAVGNVVNLVLGRNLDRQREFALRRALGARAGDILRLLLAEALLLGLAAGGLGLGAAVAGVSALSKVQPAGLPRLSSLGVDGSAAALALGIVVLLSLVVGTFPFLALGRRVAAPSLEGIGRSRTVGDRKYEVAHGVLVVGQLALTVALLCASGMLLRSFERLVGVDPGFRAQSVAALDVFLSASRYPDQESVSDFYERLLRRVRALPSVEAAGAASALPLEEGLGCYTLFQESNPLAAREQPPCVDVYVATPGYFETLGVLLAEGRGFEEADNRFGTGALVVTRPLARRLWPGDEPLGQGASIHGYQKPWFRVVGVTGEILADGLDKPPSAEVYFPLVSPEGARRFLAHRAKMTLVVRTEKGDPLALLPAIRGLVTELDPSVATGNPRLMEDVLAHARSKTTLAAGLLLFAALAALFLGTLGLYATLAHAVRRRTGEIGVRMALGAGRARVLGLVVRRASGFVLTGLALGLLAYWGGSGFLRSLLFQMSPGDPGTLAGVTLLVFFVAAVSTLIPARRAAGVDPVEALRTE